MSTTPLDPRLAAAVERVTRRHGDPDPLDAGAMHLFCARVNAEVQRLALAVELDLCAAVIADLGVDA